MIPILYSATDPSFTSNGMGRLAEATSCTVTEARNGEYELEVTYPMTGKLYTYIKEGRIISATHDDQGDRQLFEIYRRSAPIDGLVTFYAHHISYKLNDIILDPVTATTAAAAMSMLETQTAPANPFTMEVDRVVTSGTFKTTVPMSVRAAMGGTRESLLDVFGGEYEFDNMRVILHAHRGDSSGITIRYGKNLTDLTQTYDELGTCDGVFPYWYQEKDGLVTIPEKYVARQGVTNPRIAVLDLTSEFQTKPDPTDIRTRATSWLNNNRPWVPNENIKIKFLQLWQTEEYKDVAALQRLHLCDRVNVYYPALGIEVDDVEIIKVVYNVLLDRYDEMELGEARSTFAQTLIEPVMQEVEGIIQNYPTKSFMESAIDEATTAITGGAGGVIRLIYNANDEPVELLFLDTGNKDTAIDVWRWNSAGLGHSHNGYEGPYDDLALLANGAINASQIRAGTMSAEYIKGGTLTLGGTTAQGSYGDGAMEVYDTNNTLIGEFSSGGINMYAGNIELNNSSQIVVPIEAWDSSQHPLKLYINSWDGFIITTDVDISSDIYHRDVFGLSIGRETEYIDSTPYDSASLITKIQKNTTLWESSLTPTGFWSHRDDYRQAQDDWLQTKTAFLSCDSYYGLMIRESGGSNNQLSWAFSDGIIYASGGKSRIMSTEDYATRALYCYETPTPMFGDIGEGVIGEDGQCYISFDPIFAETIDTDKYYVQLQKYGEGDCWVTTRTGGHFIVEGTPGLAFGWEVKARQKNPTYMRLDPYRRDVVDISTEDYGQLALDHIAEIKEERAA